MSPVARNAPCPCGSGKKYKHCCLATGPGPDDSQSPVLLAIREALAGREFDSMEEAEEFLSELISRHHAAPQADFHGLSPADMHLCLYDPLSSPELLAFTDPLPAAPQAPVSMLFLRLAEELAREPVRLTKKGNLPRALSRDLYDFTKAANGGAEPFDGLRSLTLNSEEDFPGLHVLHITARLAGLVRKLHGRLHLTRKAEKLLAGPGEAGIYPELLRAHCTRYNWGYQDLYPEFSLIQQSWAFSLYLLSRYGQRVRPANFYATAFVRAFPAAALDTDDVDPVDAERRVKRAFVLRTFERFAKPFGLATVEYRPRSDHVLPEVYVSATDLLGQALSFGPRGNDPARRLSRSGS